MRYLHRRRDEQGAIAVLAALVLVILLGMAALTVDVADHVNERQELHDTMDMAAHAGAANLPGNGTAAQTAVTAVAAGNDPDATPDITFYCVVGSIAGSPAGTYAVNTTHIPATCNPGPAPYTAAAYPGLRCNASICSIPCVPSTGDTCNTIRVSDSKDVPFVFAPVLGIDEGDTGSISSVACKGPCGTMAPNPMDVAVVADRTGSMSDTDVSCDGHRHQGDAPGDDARAAVRLARHHRPGEDERGEQQHLSVRPVRDSSERGLTATGTKWKWMSLPFHNDYLTAAATPTVNNSSNLVKAITCLTTKSGTGTHLAAPMKGAARYLLGIDANNLATLPARIGTPRKVLIFETDGQPQEQFTNSTTTLDGAATYPGSTNGGTACTQLGQVATNAKARGILVITVAYNLTTQRCTGSTGPTVAETLAGAASK